MTAYPPRLRPDNTRCGHPDPMTVPEIFMSLDHELGYYVSSYCAHGQGEGRGPDNPSQCRSSCKGCGAPCVCICHGGRAQPYEGYDREQEQQLRRHVDDVIREKNLAPRGPRSSELLGDILTAALHRLDRDSTI